MHHALILHCLISGHALLALVCLVQLANCDSCSANRILWHPVQTHQSVCINKSLSVHQQRVQNVQECILRANKLSGLLVAQLNADTRQCSVFHYQSVCHLIDAAASSAHHTQHSCTVYANPSAKSRIEFHKKLSTKFQGVWVMSDDEDASKSNLVCNGQTQQWQAINVTFTSEGAKFDGTSSKMTLENVNFGDLSLGLTWLLRLKRQPSSYQAFLENFDCDSDTIGAHLFEWPLQGKINFGTTKQFTPTKDIYSTAIMTSDPNQFVNIGITAVPASELYNLYHNGGFVTDVTTGSHNCGTTNPQPSCFSLGHRIPSQNLLTGTVRAVGIANFSLTEAEISRFFDLVK